MKPKSRTKNQRNCKKLCEFFFSPTLHFIFQHRVFLDLCSNRKLKACCLLHTYESRILLGNWCCCIAACHLRHSISTYTLFDHAFPRNALHGTVFLFHFITKTDVFFSSDLCCHRRCCKSYFVWHEWDIFCLIKFKLCCSVWFGLVWCTLYTLNCSQFSCMWCNFNVVGSVFFFFPEWHLSFNATFLPHSVDLLAFMKKGFVNASDAKRTCDANANIA